ncbi:hypothetical protein SAMN04488542_12217, partial [Fontibacillus panacisegetis]
MRSRARSIIAATLAAGLTLGTANTVLAAGEPQDNSIESELETLHWCPPTSTPT